MRVLGVGGSMRWFAVVVFGLFSVSPLSGQTARDVVQGRVLSPDSSGLPNVTVTVLDSATGTPSLGRTDAQGAYSITIAAGSGTYMVRVQVLGMRPESRRVVRGTPGQPIVANFRLTLAPTQLATVRVQAQRARPPREDGFLSDIGLNPLFASGGSFSAAADMATLLGSVPGLASVQGGEGAAGFSAFGLGGDQNRLTINGMSLGSADLPRTAMTNMQVSTSPSDPSRGGFSGGLASVNVFSGSNFRNQSLLVALEDPALQSTDRAAALLGQKYRNILVSTGVTGALILDKLYYNVSAQVTRRSADLASLGVVDPLALGPLGFAFDSVTRFQGLAGSRGIPLATASAPTDRVSDGFSMLARFDLSPTGSKAANLLVSGRYNRSGALGIGPTSFAAAGGDSRSMGGSAVYTYSMYPGNGFLQEFKASVNMSRRETEPYLTLPAGRVRINSTLSDGTAGIGTVGFGGASSMPDKNSDAGWEFQSNTSWMSRDAKHRLKFAASARYDRYDQTVFANRYGTFTYNSLADFERGIPQSFSRSLTPRERQGAAYSWFTSIGDLWRKSNALSLQYGLRLEGNAFQDLPQYNPDIARQFGMRTDRGPNRVHLSPRFGMRYITGLPTAPTAFFDDRKMWAFSGSLGEYRNLLPATLLGSAFDATGLPSAWQQVSCFGPAAPIADWRSYVTDPNAIPQNCADGSLGSSFVDAQRAVIVFDPRFDASRSWRANFGIGRRVGPLQVRTEATYSLNLDQRSGFDQNFAGTPRFTLSGEGARPVFVPASSVDPRTGAVSPRGNRVNDQYGAVTVQRSDLRSHTLQYNVQIGPARFANTYNWYVNWTVMDTRAQTRGFAGSTVGDPRVIEWGPQAFAPRHSANTTLGVNIAGALRITLDGRLSSGIAFSPSVAGDINGDGMSNDRAFIYDPRSTNDTALARGLQRIIDSAPDYVGRCLTRQRGRLAGLNSCRGPWTATYTLRMGITPGRLGTSPRLSTNIFVTNPLGGIDRLVNGNAVRGWGQQAFPDASLLYVRGFDPVQQRFIYEVNPRFGDARASRTAIRSPFRVSIEARLRLSQDADLQDLNLQLALGRTRKGDRLSADQYKQRFSRINLNPIPQLLQMRDSLSLTKEQADSLTALQTRLQARVDSIWAPTAVWLGALGDKPDLAEAIARTRETRRAATALVGPFLKEVRGQLRDDQMQLLPEFLREWFNPAFAQRIFFAGEEIFR